MVHTLIVRISPCLLFDSHTFPLHLPFFVKHVKMEFGKWSNDRAYSLLVPDHWTCITAIQVALEEGEGNDSSLCIQ